MTPLRLFTAMTMLGDPMRFDLGTVRGTLLALTALAASCGKPVPEPIHAASTPKANANTSGSATGSGSAESSGSSTNAALDRNAVLGIDQTLTTEPVAAEAETVTAATTVETPAPPPLDTELPFATKLLRRSIDQVEAIVTAATTNFSSTCPTAGKTTLVVKYKAVRLLGDVLAASSPLLARTTEETYKTRLRTALDAAAAYVIANHQSMDNSSYSQCYGGGADFMTNYHVMNGLYAYFKSTGNAAAKTHAKLMFSQVKNGQQFNVNNAPASFWSWWGVAAQKPATIPWPTLPNVAGQMFTMGVQNNDLGGNDGIPFWFIDAVESILVYQTLSSSETSCTGTEGSVGQTYGGWAHALVSSTASDCGQKVGYHTLTLAGMTRLNEQLVTRQGCTGDYLNLCKTIPYNMAAALAWTHNIRRADGAYPSVAATSTKVVQAEDSYKAGTPIALQSIFETLASYQRIKNSAPNAVNLPASFKSNFDAASTLTLAAIQAEAVASAKLAFDKTWDVFYFADAYLAVANP